MVTGAEARTSSGRLDRLTSLRFFAAMLVALHHATTYLGDLGPVSTFFETGTVGVSFFFALSGFILAWTRRTDDSPGRFYRRRFARVYPLHLVTWFTALVLLVLFGTQPSVLAILATLFLVQAWIPSEPVFFGVNPPSWSLSCEAFFYAVFPFLPLHRVTRNWVLVLAFLPLVGGVTLLGLSGQMYWATYVFPGWRLMEFVAGAALAVHMQRSGWRPPVGVPAAALVTVVGLAVSMGVLPAVIGSHHGVEDGLMLPVWLLLIAAACTADLEGLPGILTSSPLLRLGEWSFALYLTHLILLGVIDTSIPGIDGWPVVGRLVLDIVFLATAVAASAVAYYVVERPMERRLRGAAPRPEMAAG